MSYRVVIEIKYLAYRFAIEVSYHEWPRGSRGTGRPLWQGVWGQSLRGVKDPSTTTPPNTTIESAMAFSSFVLPYEYAMIL